MIIGEYSGYATIFTMYCNLTKGREKTVLQEGISKKTGKPYATAKFFQQNKKNQTTNLGTLYFSGEAYEKVKKLGICDKCRVKVCGALSTSPMLNKKTRQLVTYFVSDIKLAEKSVPSTTKIMDDGNIFNKISENDIFDDSPF